MGCVPKRKLLNLIKTQLILQYKQEEEEQMKINKAINFIKERTDENKTLFALSFKSDLVEKNFSSVINNQNEISVQIKRKREYNTFYPIVKFIICIFVIQ